MSLIHEIDYGTPASKATGQVTLTIDGQGVTVPAGTSIMRAAMDAGISVPKLCATDSVEAFAAKDGLIGHGGVVVFDDTVDMAHQARFAMEFCAIESCGKCTPCRIGAVRGTETMDKIIRGERTEANLALITDLCQTLKFGSLCALGGFTPYPVMSAIKHFPEDFTRPRLAAAAA